jgi:uncharacterized protein (TIGR03032 family)
MESNGLPTTPELPEGGQSPFAYVHSSSFNELLTELRISLFVSTYQAGKLFAVRAGEQRVSILLRTFDQPMGLAVDPRRLVVGTRGQIWFHVNAPDIAPQLAPLGRHDACFIPRRSHVTGDMRIHELAWVGDELWFVNTRFSCLATLDDRYSFVPRWRPRFITRLAAEDRCHLNGLALEAGRPRFVTALGATDSPDGWRADKSTGGVIVDVKSGEVVASGLCMPHSPRVHGGRLWVLDSGSGRLLQLDVSSGRQLEIASFPGYARGLALLGNYAFIGLSKIRETSTFGGMPISERRGQLKSGIWVCDLRSGGIAGFLEFTAGVEEIFDVQVLVGARYPAVLGFQKDTLYSTFVVPAETDS